MRLGLGLGLTAVRRGGVVAEPEPELVLIDRTAGTNIGNLTGGGNLAASFDGITSHASGTCSTLATATDAWIGKALAAPAVFGRAVAYAANNGGFGSGGGESITLTIYGKNGAAPTGPTDGTTVIGTLAAFLDQADESGGRTIESSNLEDAWDHIILRVQSTTVGTMRCAELILYEWA